MKFWWRQKKMLTASVIVLLLTALVWWTEQNETLLINGGQLLRKEKGEGEYEAELILKVDETKETEVVIIVPEQRLTPDEEERLLDLAIKEIEAEFTGENPSLKEVRKKVCIQESYQEGKVLAEWEFSNHRIIAQDGIITEEAMPDSEEEVGAKVYLSCEDSSLIYEFYFTVYKQDKSEEEQFYEKLNQSVSKIGEAEGTEFLWLPTNLEGHTLVWKDKESHLPLQVFFIGMVVVLLLPALEKEREKEAKEKREEQLLREYPEIVNKLALLLGAGMTLQGAWRQITEKYVRQFTAKQRERSEVYEEMLITQREIESGKGEQKAYENFGERCGIQKYRKLSSYLVQNMKKGNRGLCDLLQQEAAEVFEERKNMAQQFGEEVGTKLLFPMLLMLGIVIFVIMVPAVLSFQTGIN